MSGVLALLALMVPVAAWAAPPGALDPDWPCEQIEVPKLSVAAMWNGPDLPGPASWQDDGEVAALVAGLAERRVPLQEATTEIADFAAHAGAEKRQRLMALFAGLFEAADTERAAVMAGLDRFGRRQKELAASLRTEAAKLNSLQEGSAASAGEANRLSEQVNWDMRLFEQRRQTLSYACDVPASIEQRLFALARIIEQAMQ